MLDKMNAQEAVGASTIMRPSVADMLAIEGKFSVECIRDGQLLWRDEFFNTVVTVGQNALLDDALAGSAYTVTGPYMGLISSVSYSAISASDTMTSHAGWLEAGGANAPTYTGSRPTCVWSAASGGTKSLSAALSFAISGAGTIEGGFITFGSGASATVGNTGGTLLSAGVFASGARSVFNGDTVNVSYSISL